MAARLSQVEQLNQQLSAKLAKQTKEVEVLRSELEAVRSQPADGQGSPSGVHADRACHAECERLRQQVEEMTKFLADYGLTWVPRSAEAGGADADPGCNADPADAHGGRSVAEKLSRPPEPGGMAVNIQVIESRVEALNAMVEEEGPKAGVVQDRASGVGRLATEAAPPLPLTFFRDGIKLSDYAFMPYDQRPAQGLIKDVLDGYFPQALREAYPDGMLLKVIDRTGNSFRAWLREFARDDPDLADGGERLRVGGGGCAVRARRDERSAGERLVDKLPERVIRGGKVCEIRGPIAERLGARPSRAGGSGGGTGAAVRGVSAPPAGGPAAAGVQDVSMLDAGRDPAAPTARLQVKLEGGQRVYLCMEPHATIGALWDALADWRAKHGVARAGADGRACVLRTAFPPRAYTDQSESLEAAGLAPSATLFVSAEASEK